MAIISDRERLKTIDTLDANTAFLEWYLSRHRKSGILFKLPKLIERNKKQIKYLKNENIK